MNVAGFDWDDGNREKCRKHGVSLAEIEFVLSNALRIAPYLKHSMSEPRFVGNGYTDRGHPTFVVFTMRGTLVRPLSARYMHAGEIAQYDPQSS